MTHNQVWYKTQLKDERWQELKLSIHDRDNWQCQDCKWRPGKLSCLEVHHIQYIGRYPWDTPSEYLITLCFKCHRKKHSY